jgi:hypothetical protein
MLTYQDIPLMISLSEASATDLLVHAANTDEYISHKEIIKRNVPSKRKLFETSQLSSQSISLKESSVFRKKKSNIEKYFGANGTSIRCKAVIRCKVAACCSTC